MQHIRFSELPIAGESAGQRSELVSPFGDLYGPVRRRSFLQGALALGTVAGFAAMGLFRNVREARASNPPWTSFANCGASPNTTCAEPCYGFDPAYMANFLCSTCAEAQASPSTRVYQWHFQGVRADGEYRDLERTICPGPGANRDAWHWSESNCEGCSPLKWRCHDGQKKPNGSATWTSTICQGYAECDGVPYTC